MNKQTCYKKDDLFARTNEGDGYMQCQVHLRSNYLCYRPKNHIVSALRKHIKNLTAQSVKEQ